MSAHFGIPRWRIRLERRIAHLPFYQRWHQWRWHRGDNPSLEQRVANVRSRLEILDSARRAAEERLRNITEEMGELRVRLRDHEQKGTTP